MVRPVQKGFGDRVQWLCTGLEMFLTCVGALLAPWEGGLALGQQRCLWLYNVSNGPVLWGMITASQQIANVPLDIPVGENPGFFFLKENLSLESNSVLHINTQYLFICMVLTYTESPRNAAIVKIEKGYSLFWYRILPRVSTVSYSPVPDARLLMEFEWPIPQHDDRLHLEMPPWCWVGDLVHQFHDFILSSNVDMPKLLHVKMLFDYKSLLWFLLYITG